MTIALLLPLLLLIGVAGAAGAQTPPPAVPDATPAAADAPPVPPPDYAYTPDGRRDPFVSLVNRGVDGGAGPDRGTRPAGVSGLLIDEVAVRGIVQSRDAWVAMVSSPAGRTYSIRPGDRLLDGSVHAITARAVVFMQDVEDPRSLDKQREVRKTLRGEVK